MASEQYDRRPHSHSPLGKQHKLSREVVEQKARTRGSELGECIMQVSPLHERPKGDLVDCESNHTDANEDYVLPMFAIEAPTVEHPNDAPDIANGSSYAKSNGVRYKVVKTAEFCQANEDGEIERKADC